jgi:hypothetical protein
MVQVWALNSVSASSASGHANVNHRKSSAVAVKSSGLRLARGLFFALAIVLLFGGLSWVRTFASEENVQPAAASELVIYADAGDTLWELAASYKKPSMDTRKAVHLLMERNHLSSSSLRSGQALIVPVQMLP